MQLLGVSVGGEEVRECGGGEGVEGEGEEGGDVLRVAVVDFVAGRVAVVGLVGFEAGGEGEGA